VRVRRHLPAAALQCTQPSCDASRARRGVRNGACHLPIHLPNPRTVTIFPSFPHPLPPSHAVVGFLPLPGVVFGLSMLCTLLVLRVLLDFMHFLHRASRDPQDTVAWAAHMGMTLVAVPDSLHQVR
jgi:hypothetical protein